MAADLQTSFRRKPGASGLTDGYSQVSGVLRKLSTNNEQRLAEFDRLAIFDEDLLDRATGIGVDLVK